jgi:TIR domain
MKMVDCGQIAAGPLAAFLTELHECRTQAMAYLPDFDHDIFISYSHLNNPPGESGTEGWVTGFHNALDAALRQLTGKELKVWRDPRVAGNQLFDRTIQQAVESAGVFLALNSYVYQESDYCQQELQWFTDKAQADGWGLRLGDRTRIFHLRLNNIPSAEWPVAFSGARGYQCYEEGPDDEIGLPCDLDTRVFRTLIKDLVRDLYRTLQAFRRAILNAQMPGLPSTKHARGDVVAATGQANGHARCSPTPSCTVFLADISDTLRKMRQRRAAELHEKGVALAESVPPPWESQLHDEKAAAEMQRAQLCVHLFDAWPGREMQDQPDQYYIYRQVSLAQQQAKPQLFWTPPLPFDLHAIEDDEHRQFLLRLAEGPREGGARYNFVRESPSTLAQVVIDKLHQLQAAFTPRANATILLDTHLKDDDYAITLRQILLDQFNIKSYINQGEDNPGGNVAILEARLRQVGRMIIIFGQVAESWVFGRLAHASEIANKENIPLHFGIYYTAQRRKGNDGLLRLGSLQVYEFDDTDLRNPQALRPLLAGI